MSESPTQKYRIEKVAPDGGVWGFLVALGVAIPLVIYLFISFACTVHCTVQLRLKELL